MSLLRLRVDRPRSQAMGHGVTPRPLRLLSVNSAIKGFGHLLVKPLTTETSRRSGAKRLRRDFASLS
jgi:hypothetical protein